MLLSGESTQPRYFYGGTTVLFGFLKLVTDVATKVVEEIDEEEDGGYWVPCRMQKHSMTTNNKREQQSKLLILLPFNRNPSLSLPAKHQYQRNHRELWEMDDIYVDTDSSKKPSPHVSARLPLAMGPSNDNEDRGLSNNAPPTKTPCRPVVPIIWGNNNRSPDEYLSRDDNVVRENRWGGSWVPVGADIVKTMELLVADQHDPYSVELIQTNFLYYNKWSTQIPYHQRMMPHFSWWAESIQGKEELESFRIDSIHLPPQSFFRDRIIPALEGTASLHTLQLSNCLNNSDVPAVSSFLMANKTLHSLDLSRCDLDLDTAMSLARAIKGHPVLYDIDLKQCSLGGGNVDVLNKILVACKDGDRLAIGHPSFTPEGLALIARFLGKKISLTSFSLVSAPIDKDSQKLLAHSLKKNKSLSELALLSNGLKLPAILDKNDLSSLSRLTSLDLSHNSLPKSGAGILAEFLGTNNTLVSLVLSKCRIGTKSAEVFLPVLNGNTTLLTLDLSRNFLNNDIAPTIVALLKSNATLSLLDLRENKALKAKGRRWEYRYNHELRQHEQTPVQPKGRELIIERALFDTSSLDAIASSSNHTCALKMGGKVLGTSDEGLLRKIQSLENEGLKIRLKVVLALTEKNKGLFDVQRFSSVPLELMPRLFELIQQKIGYHGFGKEIVSKADGRFKNCIVSRYIWPNRTVEKYNTDFRLGRLYSVIMAWNVELLFQRGSAVTTVKITSEPDNNKKRRKPKRKIGDDDDSDDADFKPPSGMGSTRRRMWMWDDELGRHTYKLPPPREPTRKSNRLQQ